MRNLDLNDLRVFVRVVECGGFAPAARELGVPTSTVSRTIARLEESAGARLLERTSRSVHATNEGRAVHASVKDAVATLERAALSLEPPNRKPRGVLRVTAPPDFGATFLADVCVAFCERHPLVQLEVSLTNRAVSLVNERFDVAVRAASHLQDSSLVAKRVGPLVHALFASPAHLEKFGAPHEPADLARHPCVAFRAKDLVKTWTLARRGETHHVAIQARISGDDFGYVRAAVVAGGGIALMPVLVCAKDEAAGHLVRVLPEFTAKGADLYVLHASASHVPPRVSAFRDFVVAAFAAAR